MSPVHQVGRLTVANPALQAQINATPPGMMHWADTGPRGAVCFGCDQFNQRKLRTRIDKVYPQTVRGACSKYIRITTARTGGCVRKVFDPMTPACSHFNEAPPWPETPAAEPVAE
jgi:hypothetical protein